MTRPVRIAVSLLLLTAAGFPAAASPRDDKPKPKLPIGKETTVVDGPLDKDGYIDYEAALNERLGKGITPERNACAGLWAALGPKPEKLGKGMPKEYFKLLGIAEPPAAGDYFVNLFDFLKRIDNLPEDEFTEVYQEQEARCKSRPWAARGCPRVAAWLAANEKPLSVAVEAVKRPDYFHPLCSDRTENQSSNLLGHLSPNVQAVRGVASALAARAMLNTHAGKYDEAWQDLLACHRLARHAGRGATFVETLVGIALHQVASTATLAYLDKADLSAQLAMDRLAELRKLPPLPVMADKFDLGERFMHLDAVQMVRRGRGLIGGRRAAREEAALAAIDWEPALKSGNAFYDRMVAASRTPNRAEREKLFTGIDEDLQRQAKKKIDIEDLLQELTADLRKFRDDLEKAKAQAGNKAGKAVADLLLGLMMPAARRMQESGDRAEQVNRNLHVAIALHAYKKDAGQYPAKLADLAPKYLPSIPDDLFSGKSLVYKPDDTGYLFYSVGPNGTDDGGRWYGDAPRGDDPNVRMPLPALKK